MTSLEKEVRSVLLGKTKLLDDGRLSTLESGDYIMPRGITDGAGAVRFFGVARKAKILKSELSESELKEIAVKAMRNIGRGLVLQEDPEAAACLLRYVATRPAVLCFATVSELPVITAYTGRGLTGWISLIRAMRAFRKQLPDTVTFSDEQAPDPRKEEKERKKQEKEERKLAKKKRQEREEGIRPEPENGETEEENKEAAEEKAAEKE